MSMALTLEEYNHHLQYDHGVSAASGLPFAPPRALSGTSLTSKAGALANCAQCRGLIPLGSPLHLGRVSARRRWWRHARQCPYAKTMHPPSRQELIALIDQRIEPIQLAASIRWILHCGWPAPPQLE